VQEIGSRAAYSSWRLPTNGYDVATAFDKKLVIDKVTHRTFVAFVEDITEAAAATVVLMMPVSAPLDPVTVRLNRTFCYHIVDRTSGTNLFIGQVTTRPLPDTSRRRPGARRITCGRFTSRNRS
jgi:hypothetical protein